MKKFSSAEYTFMLWFKYLGIVFVFALLIGIFNLASSGFEKSLELVMGIFLFATIISIPILIIYSLSIAAYHYLFNFQTIKQLKLQLHGIAAAVCFLINLSFWLLIGVKIKDLGAFIIFNIITIGLGQIMVAIENHWGGYLEEIKPSLHIVDKEIQQLIEQIGEQKTEEDVESKGYDLEKS